MKVTEKSPPTAIAEKDNEICRLSENFKTTEESLRKSIRAEDADEDHYINAMVQTRLDKRHQREKLGREKTKVAVLKARPQIEVGNRHQAQRDLKTTKEIL